MSDPPNPRQSQINPPAAAFNNTNIDDTFNCTDFMLKLFDHVPKPKLKLPNNRHITNAWTVYEPSCQTENLVNEIGRTIYAESFQLTPASNEYIVEDLRILTLQCLIKHYHDYDNLKKYHLSANDIEYFGENLDIELPVQNLIDLENDFYWRRVAEAKCKDKYKNLIASQTDGFLCWKQMGIAAKLAELIENALAETWDESNLVEIARKIKSEVYELDIRQMKPLCDFSLEQSLYNKLYKIYNYPPDCCHHGNLGLVIAELTNLTSLSLKFGNEIEMYSYEKRHFDISYKDIENLSKGLRKLKNLEKFTFHRSFLDDRKLKTLIRRGLVNCSLLNHLDLSYCRLTDDSGSSIGYFLTKNNMLQRLELRGNEIGSIGCQGIGYGLQQFKGSLEYLGLAGNPISEQGVLNIGAGFCQTEHVRQLDFSQCDVDENGAYRMAQIIGFHLPLTGIDLSCVPLGENGGEKLLANLMKHKTILCIECRGCGLTENQERQIKILLERNQFLQDAPLLDKDFITEADAEEIDEWINTVRHPIMKKVFDRKPVRDSWLNRNSKCEFDTIPAFIPKEQRKICTNSDILGVDVYGYQSDDNSIVEDPNQFNENEIVENILMGRNIDETSTTYF